MKRMETETKKNLILLYNRLFDLNMCMYEKIIELQALLNYFQSDEEDSKIKLSAIAHVTEDLYMLSAQTEKQLAAYDEAINVLFVSKVWDE